jgi:hypothetical protein
MSKYPAEKSSTEEGTPPRRRFTKIGVIAAAATLAGGLAYGLSSDQAAQPGQVRATAEQGPNPGEQAARQARIDRAKKMIGNLDGIDPKIVSGEALVAPESLPGYNQKISPEQQAALRAATVQIGFVSQHGATAPGQKSWLPLCAGVKITQGDQAYVLAAAHCVAGDLPPTIDAGAQGSLKAQNITGKTGYDYAILDGNLAPAERWSSPELAEVTGLAVDRSGSTDWALLQVKSNPSSPNSFDGIPAVNADTITGGTQLAPPTPGQQGAAVAFPAAAGNQRVEAMGTYLGRVPVAPGNSLAIDLVGFRVDPETPEQNPCHADSAGSSVALADGTVLGPLSMLNRIGPDSSQNQEPRTPGEERSDYQNRLSFETATKVNMDDYNNVCAYSVAQPGTLDQLAAVLK